ncbi:hypothetical protein [Algoriphagus sp.]|uniref:hypothetical protein n=1 Tax=Algoriphagus sp. TaxID=1872435 RepID=UPI0026059D62|nr:hypothetical protein [Algoriphagus sp.]
MERDKKHLTHCFELIAKKLSRGPLDTWVTGDFQLLSKSIHEETGTLLSVSTLKRLSGKVNYSSRPNTSTLNVLAAYLGYGDWHSFVFNESTNHSQRKKKGTPSKTFQYSKPLIVVGLVLVTVLLWVQRKSEVSYDPNDFDFDATSVSEGLPNSVVFNYNARAATADAVVAIQQDWDNKKRIEVDREDSISTSIYHWPGYFKAKLVVNDSIVKEKSILIPTDGWLATIETDSLPIYLDKKLYQTENELHLTPKILQAHGVNPQIKRTITGFYNVDDFQSIYTDDFQFSINLKNNLKSGASPCQAAQIQIIHEDGPISLVLSNKGCISDISLFAFDTTIDGKKTDLSGFGTDMSENIKVECLSKGQKMNILVNEESVFTFNVPKIPKKIIGVKILFEGAGSIYELQLSNKKGTVYHFGTDET